jgi:hypothetical protein
MYLNWPKMDIYPDWFRANAIHLGFRYFFTEGFESLPKLEFLLLAIKRIQ